MEFERVRSHFNEIINDNPLDVSLQVDYQLFALSQKITLKQWKEIRKGDYWDVTKTMSREEKNYYLLTLVRAYFKIDNGRIL